MTEWRPTHDQTTTARARVAATWARLLAERHPGHRFIVEWREGRDTTDAPALPRKVDGEIVDQEDGRSAA